MATLGVLIGSLPVHKPFGYVWMADSALTHFAADVVGTLPDRLAVSSDEGTTFREANLHQRIP